MLPSLGLLGVAIKQCLTTEYFKETQKKLVNIVVLQSNNFRNHIHSRNSELILNIFGLSLRNALNSWRKIKLVLYNFHLTCTTQLDHPLYLSVLLSRTSSYFQKWNAPSKYKNWSSLRTLKRFSKQLQKGSALKSCLSKGDNVGGGCGLHRAVQKQETNVERCILIDFFL